MGRNSRYDSRRREFQETRCQNMRNLRARVRRSSNGKVLGVFKGIAESMGWSICLTRWLGVVALLGLTGMFGVHGLSAHVLTWGFFYLLLAAMMGPPRETPAFDAPPPDGRPAFGEGWRSPVDPPSTGRSAARSYAAAYQPPVDLAALDRQLESLNRRIRRMESVVTDPSFDWDRRLGK